MFIFFFFLFLGVPFIYQAAYFYFLSKDGFTDDEKNKFDRLMRLAFSFQMAIIGLLLIFLGNKLHL